MANQDYVTRTPAKKKNNTRKSKKSAPKANKFRLKAKLIIGLLIVLIGGFAYALWSLKTSPSTKIPLSQTSKAEKNKTNQATKALPKPPKEKWTYVKDLENQVIEPGEYEVEEKGPYKMQCGSFKTAKQAESLKAQIAFVGLEAQVKSVTGKNGTWHKVFLGPYPKKRLAEKDKHKLKRNNINYCQIWYWR